MGQKYRDSPNVGIGMNSCKINSFDLVIGDEISPHREAWIDLGFVFSINPSKLVFKIWLPSNDFTWIFISSIHKSLYSRSNFVKKYLSQNFNHSNTI